jgi:O-antigen ligase
VGAIVRFITDPTYFSLLASGAAIIKLIFSFFWMVAVYILVSRDPYPRIWTFALTTAVVAGGLGLVGSILNIFPSVSGRSGPFTNRNLYANYLTLSLFLSLSWLYWLRQNKETHQIVTLIFALSSGIAFYVLLSTASRAPTAGLVLGLAVATDWRAVGRSLLRDVRLAISAVLGTGILISVIIVNDFFIFQRFAAALNGSALGYRLQAWPQSIEGFLSYPLFGIGLGQHPYYLTYVTPHNTLILVASATGLVGSVIALWFVIGLLRRAFAVRFIKNQHYLGIFTGFFISSLVVGMFHDINNFRSFWIAAGLLTASAVELP